MGVTEVAFGLFAQQSLDSSDHATMKLEVIIAVKNIVLSVVLIMNGDFYGSQPVGKSGTGVDPFRYFAAISITSPVDVAFRKV